MASQLGHIERYTEALWIAADRPTRFTVELMHGVPDIYSLLAELAIALAGFTGVSSAFAGRERLFRPMERTRLQAVLLGSSSVLAGCLARYSAASLGFGDAEAASIAAAVGILLTLPFWPFLSQPVFDI